MNSKINSSADQPSEIIPNLYISNSKYAKAIGDTDTYDLIVNCTPSLPLPTKTSAIRIPIEDDPNDSDLLFQIIKEINVSENMHEMIIANKKVLVHCQAGAQRSPAVVACYMIKYHGMTPQQSIDLIRQKRSIAFFWTVNLYQTLRLTYDHAVLKCKSPDQLSSLNVDHLLSKV